MFAPSPATPALPLAVVPAAAAADPVCPAEALLVRGCACCGRADGSRQPAAMPLPALTLNSSALRTQVGARRTLRARPTGAFERRDSVHSTQESDRSRTLSTLLSVMGSSTPCGLV